MRTAAALFTLAFTLSAQDPKDKVKVGFQDVELETLARQVEKVTKKSFVYQEQILKNKKVTLQSESAITPDEFYRVFQSICLMHGLALVPAQEDDLSLVKIVPSQQAVKEPGLQPVLKRGEAIPPGDAIIYYLMAPKHITAAKALAVIATVSSPIGVVQQVPGSDTVLLFDTASAVRRAEKMLSMLDVPGEPVVALPLTLKHVSAADAKAQATDFALALEKAASGETGRGRLAVLSTERTNVLHLVGPQAEVKRVAEFVRDIDRDLPSAKRTIEYYRLKNVPVAEVVDPVRRFLGLAVAARESDRRRQGKAGTKDFSGAPTLPPGVGRPGQDEPPAQEPAPVTPAPAAEGKTDIEVVPLDSFNMLAVVGNQTVHDEVKKIIENLDKRKAQVLIEVAIVQVSGDDSLTSGVEVLFEDPMKGGARLNGGTGFGQSTQSGGSGFPTTQTLSSFTGGAARYLKADEISVLLRALATRANINIMSQPLLLVNDNEGASFATKVSEPTLLTSQGTATTTTSFAGFADAVTSLTITPQISPDGYLNLKITQSFEEFTGASSVAGVPPPKVSNNVTTVITVPDRYTAIIGGFTRDSATETRSGIPFLMDIPLLGELFSTQSVKVTKSRLYLFVRPRILTAVGFGDLKDVSQEKSHGLRPMVTHGDIAEGLKQALEPLDQGIKEAPLPLRKKE